VALRDDWFLSYDVADGFTRLGWRRAPATHIEGLYQMRCRVATEAISPTSTSGERHTSPETSGRSPAA
jgi:hypothetical protein